MPFKSYRDESRKNYGQGGEEGLCLEQIRTGALLRIADATELMAKNYQQLIDNCNYYKRQTETLRAELRRLGHKVAALRAVITRQKRAIEGR